MSPVTATTRSCFGGLARLVVFAALFAASVCSVSQDKQQGTNANAAKDEDEIRQLSGR
jgi:hypothetical protein